MATQFSKYRSRPVALGGILGAGSIALLWIACITPAARMGLTAAAGLFPVVAVLGAGSMAGYLCWATAGILGLVILPDKAVALLYLVFLGLYPVVKSWIESRRKLLLEWFLKLFYFNAVFTLFWLVAREWILPNPPIWLQNSVIILYALCNLVFVVYDLGLSQLIAMLRTRMIQRHY